MLFVNPNSRNKYTLHPLGLARLAAVLRDAHDVRILDLDAVNGNDATLRNELSKFNPDIVGVTVKTPCLGAAQEACKVIKDAGDFKLIVGGADPTARPDQILSDLPADVAVQGEAEELITPLVENINDTNFLKTIPGLTIRTPNGVVQTERRGFVEDLDKLPFTAYDLLPLDRYKAYPLNMPEQLLIMITSRGCPWACTYCFHAIHGHKPRAHSAEYVINEITHMESLPIKLRSIIFVDDTFTFFRDRTIDICRGVQDKNISFRCESRVNVVDEELLGIMYESGFKHISFGVESGNQRIIDEWNKKITKAQVRSAFKAAHKVGLTTSAYFIIGAPSETPETVQDSIDFAKELNADFTQWSLASPLPSTALHDWYVENFGEIIDWSGTNYSSVFQRERPQMSIYRGKYMTNEELNCWVKKAYRAVYFNPRYILKRLRRMTDIQEVKANLLGLKDILEGQF